jgi:hypothetical protein
VDEGKGRIESIVAQGRGGWVELYFCFGMLLKEKWHARIDISSFLSPCLVPEINCPLWSRMKKEGGKVERWKGGKVEEGKVCVEDGYEMKMKQDEKEKGKKERGRRMVLVHINNKTRALSPPVLFFSFLDWMHSPQGSFRLCHQSIQNMTVKSDVGERGKRDDSNSVQLDLHHHHPLTPFVYC